MNILFDYLRWLLDSSSSQWSFKREFVKKTCTLMFYPYLCTNKQSQTKKYKRDEYLFIRLFTLAARFVE
jgi:hypothetical protein